MSEPEFTFEDYQQYDEEYVPDEDIPNPCIIDINIEDYSIDKH